MPRRLPLPTAPAVWRDLTIDPFITDLLQQPNTVVAVGVSGGKDSAAVALAVAAYLKRVGFAGPVVLIHSDLGEVEWAASLPTCERIAAHVGWELQVVRRKAGGLLHRWRQRWANSVTRYTSLSCVKVILPWSTATMRFCTAELKRDPICSALVKRFPGCNILSVAGIRRDESNDRRNAPVYKPEPKLTSKTHKTQGWAWNAIADWELAQVLTYLEQEGFELHEAYTEHGSTRVSCVFCILGNKGDLQASAAVPANQPVYLAMVDLEIASAFAFKSDTWLGDVAPHLLDAARTEGLARAKDVCAARAVLEAEIPEHLLYEKGWPKGVPTLAEASLLAGVRSAVGKLQGFTMKFTTPQTIQDRYREILRLKEQKAAQKRPKSPC